MEPRAGRLLVATTALMDPNFWRTVILLINGDVDGHIGLILNRPTLELVSTHLADWSEAVVGEGLVHFGGPVEPDVAIVLLRDDQGEATGLPGVTLGDLGLSDAPATQARIYAGYSGWSAGQLQAEIAEGAWVVVPARPEDPFDPPQGQWERVLKRQGGRLALMSTYPVDVSLN